MPVCPAFNLIVAVMFLLCAECLSVQEPCLSANGTEVLCGDPPAAPVPYGGKVCVGDVDVRGGPEQMEILRGCRVVEGFVHITLIHSTKPSDFQKYQFPELVEITSYLLLYMVKGLTSVRQLFPNLAVIRGIELLQYYALTIYDMEDLRDVGLTNLAVIPTGRVLISGTPALCFGNTINWNAIVQGATENPLDHTVPKHCGNMTKACEQCADHLCWSQDPNSCQAPTHRPGCHPLCIGPCTGPRLEDCIYCPDYRTPNQTCVPECPEGLYKFNRRCITIDECRKLSFNEIVRKRLTSSGSYGAVSITTEDSAPLFWAFNGSCIRECPPGYQRVNSTLGMSCEPCPVGRVCQKVCKGTPPGTKIKSIADAQRYEGCTIIKGSLEIEITKERNDTLIQEYLGKFLGDVQEIEMSLRVTHSVPLQSLNFLKNLTVVHGAPRKRNESLVSQNSTGLNSAFVILDNANLQELWDWDRRPNGRKFEIKSGLLSFHDNPRLCPSKIKELASIASMSTEFKESEVSSTSNGDKFPCHSTKIKATVSVITSASIIIDISRPKVDKSSSSTLSLRYVVYYSKRTHDDVTAYEGPDECGSNEWKISETTISENDTEMANPEKQSHLLNHLEPDTLYAFYVRTYNLTSGGLSPIQHVRTLPARPSLPLDVKAHSNSSSQIVLSWKPPRHPHGNLTGFLLKGFLREYNQTYLEQRNYCHHKPQQVVKENATFPVDFISDPSEMDIALPVECQKKKSSVCKDLEHSSSVNWDLEEIRPFQCGNYMLKWLELSALTADSAPDDFPTSSSPYDLTDNLNIKEEKDINGRYTSFVIPVSNDTILYTINNLVHFSEYVLLLSACREVIKNDTEAHCSYDVFITAKTLSLENADNVDSNSISASVKNETVLIEWDEPSNPNGAILSYHIEYHRESESNHKFYACSTRPEYLSKNKSYEIKDILAPGDYKFRIFATSLFGPGDPSEYKSFVILEKEGGSYTALFILLTISISVILIVCLFVYFYLKKKAMEANLKLYASVNPDYFRMPYVVDEWEVPRRNVHVVRELGVGSFGMVSEGILYPDQIKCAIKTVQTNKEGDVSEWDVNEFLNEASVMKAFCKAHHIVKLLGVVSVDKPPLAIMELMALGDLKSFLRRSRDQPEFQPSTKRICKMAAQIADGMAYLEARKFVHRDLAARNCMVDENFTVKIGDFGMTRDVYETDYYKKGDKGLLPIRWMAPESLGDGIFTSSSDSWSYGVVLWEIATLAEQPYQGLSNEQVLQYILNGQILNTPEEDFSEVSKFPEALKTLMNQCWNWRPEQRPSFLAILEILDPTADDDFRSLSFYHSEEGEELRKNFKERSQKKASKDEAQVMAFMSSSSEKFYSPKQLVNTLFKSKSQSKGKALSGSSASSYVLTDAYVPLRQFTDDPDGEAADDYMPSTSKVNPTINGHVPSTSRS